MFKKALLILIGLTLLTAGAARAAYPVPQQGTLPFYWLEGRVTDSNGAGIANRQVHFTKNAESFDRNKISVTTDSRGYYRLNVYELQYYYNVEIAYAADNPEKEKYQLWVLPAGGDNLGTIETVALSAAAGFMTKNLVLIPGGAGSSSLLVKVEEENGAAISGATVLVDGNNVWPAVEESGGQYRIASLPAGPHMVSAQKAGYQTGIVLVDLSSQGENRVTIVLKKIPDGYGEVFGFVRDDLGQGLAGALVYTKEASTMTITSGFYSLLLPVGKQLLTASKINYDQEGKLATVLNQQSTELNFTLKPRGLTGTITGLVTSAVNNTPISGAVVTNGDLVVTTATDGTYTIRNVPVGVHVVRALKGGFYPGSREATVAAGATVTVNLTLRPFSDPNNGAISGYVRSATMGTRLPGALVKISSQSGGTAILLYTENDGFYFSGELAPASYRLEASKEEYQTATAEAVVSPSGLALVDFNLLSIFGPAGTVRLKISRVGNDIKIEPLDLRMEREVVFYVLAGDGKGRYQNAYSAEWKAHTLNNGSVAGEYAAEFTLSEDHLLHKNQVGTGRGEVYYKLLYREVDPTTSPGAATFETAPVVGKVNVVVEGSGGLKLVGVPVVDGTISQIFPGQLAPGEILYLYPQTGSGLDKRTLSSTGVTGAELTVGPTTGFWLENPGTSQKTITFVGGLPTAFSRDLAKLDLTGNPLPLILSSSLLGGAVGDTIYPQVGKGLDKITRTSVGWKDFSLLMSEGFWYEYVSGSRKLETNLSQGKAEIKQ